MNEQERDIQWAQRIAVLELKVEQYAKSQEQIVAKLDELLQLKAKGMGAFWLVSTILGTGLIGIVLAVVNWVKNNG